MKKLFIIIATALCLAGCSEKSRPLTSCVFSWEQDPLVFCKESSFKCEAVGKPEITIQQYADDYSFLDNVYTSKTNYAFLSDPAARYILVSYRITLRYNSGLESKCGGYVNKVWDLSQKRTIRVTFDDEKYIGDASVLLRTYFE